METTKKRAGNSHPTSITELNKGDVVHLKHHVYGSIQGFVMVNSIQSDGLITINIKQASSKFRKFKRIWPEGNTFHMRNLEFISGERHRGYDWLKF